MFPQWRVVLAAAMALCSVVPRASAQVRADVYASGFSLPIAFVQDPLSPTVQYVVEQRGRIRVVINGAIAASDFLNLSTQVSAGGEQGLLGLAFSPDYAGSGRFYVNFTDTAGNTVIARFKRSGSNPLIADGGTRFDLMWPGGTRYILQPAANHNGGSLAFGPDGYLYVGLGDGGGANDTAHNAQNPSTLLGKMLRIDVNVPDSDPEGYHIPAGNPFVDGQPVPALSEIWAFGLRNPWKYSFDDPARGGTGALIIADVGQGSWEEIDYEPRDRGGRNYGWRNREGLHNNVLSLPPAYLPLVDPILEYDHSVGCSVTGGHVYRGTALGSPYVGRYFFADFCAGRVWSVALAISGTTGEATASNLVEHTAELGGSASLGLISSFGVDAYGELYILSYGSGRVLRILPPYATLTTGVSFPATWGTPITWTATASSGIPPLQYQFWLLKQGVGWSLAQAYSTLNTFSWTPTAADVGTYLLQVWVRSTGSSAPWETWAGSGYFDITSPAGGAPCTSVSLGASASFPVATGTAVTWTAQATGCSAADYQFWLYSGNTATWSELRTWSPTNTAAWTPAQAGTYALQVWARRAGSTATWEAWAGSGYFTITTPAGGAPCASDSLGASASFPVATGTAVTWTAQATGCSAAEYQFWLYSASSATWIELRTWSPTNTVAWTPAQAGAYVVQVWARRAGSTATWEAWAGSGYFNILP